MAIRIIASAFLIALGIAFLWFVAQVAVLGTKEFFRKRKGK